MKNIIPEIKDAKPLKGYKFIEFNDGVSGTIDLVKWKNNPAFYKWENEENFKVFSITKDRKIDCGNDIQMDPDAFYLQLINKTFEEYAG